MARKAKSKSGRRAKPLYHSAKISDYQFKKVLWHFTLDHSAAEAAKHIKLSANSISAIYAKLRKFFFDYGLFNDPYKGGDPREGLPYEGVENAELAMLEFHFERVREKHGALDSNINAPDYHFAESNWRFDHFYLWLERGGDAAHRKMYSGLMAFIRKFGPVGAPREATIEDRLSGAQFALAQIRDYVLWLERNAERFREADKRAALRAMRGAETDRG